MGRTSGPVQNRKGAESARSVRAMEGPLAAAAAEGHHRQPRVAIEYCTGCKWGMRAAWQAQELLRTFEAELNEVALLPGRSGGIYNVWVNDVQVWDRRKEKRFPEMKELKQLVRNLVCPDRGLGHSDSAVKAKADAAAAGEQPAGAEDNTS